MVWEVGYKYKCGRRWREECGWRREGRKDVKVRNPFELGTC